MSAIASTRIIRLLQRTAAYRNRPLGFFGGLRPKKISFPRIGRFKLMPRMFRRGLGLGGLFRMRRRRAGLRKRVYRKKTQNKIHTYVRWADKDTLYPGESGPNQILASSTAQNLAYSFKLDNVVNPSDFTNLYDQYRINKVVLYLERSRNSSDTASGYPINRKISVVHDYNDNNLLTQEDDYLEYSNCKRYNVLGNGAIKITLYPKINNIIENVGGSSNAFTSMSSNRVWLNIAEDEVPHFGLKVFVPPYISEEGQLVFTVRAKFYLSMKQSK